MKTIRLTGQKAIITASEKGLQLYRFAGGTPANGWDANDVGGPLYGNIVPDKDVLPRDMIYVDVEVDE